MTLPSIQRCQEVRNGLWIVAVAVGREVAAVAHSSTGGVAVISQEKVRWTGGLSKVSRANMSAAINRWVRANAS